MKYLQWKSRGLQGPQRNHVPLFQVEQSGELSILNLPRFLWSLLPEISFYAKLFSFFQTMKPSSREEQTVPDFIRHLGDPNSILELTLDNILITEFSNLIRKAIESLPKLLSLSMNNCGIPSLKSFPHLPRLIQVLLQIA